VGDDAFLGAEGQQATAEADIFALPVGGAAFLDDNGRFFDRAIDLLQDVSGGKIVEMVDEEFRGRLGILGLRGLHACAGNVLQAGEFLARHIPARDFFHGIADMLVRIDDGTGIGRIHLPAAASLPYVRKGLVIE